MSGRALIIVVTGIIITTTIILFNISASSTRIVQNLNNYYLRQSAQNIAQSGVNLCLTQLAIDRNWRTGFTLLDMMGGKVTVRVFDTTYAGVNNDVVGIQSTGIESYNTTLEKRAVSTVYGYFPPFIVPDFIKALVTLNGVNQINGNITLDGRDHNPFSVAVNPGTGNWGIWSTAPTFDRDAASTVGGTTPGFVDIAPTSAPLDTPVIRLNQTYPGGYPTSPDSAFGYDEGTLKALAQTGFAGSQYVTDPADLKYPLSGVTYVEMPNTVPQNRWNANKISGTGMLIIHNSAHNANMDNAGTDPPGFSGIIIGDDITHTHGDIWGAIMLLSPNPLGNVMGNGNANLRYSRLAIKSAVGIVKNGTQKKILGWYE